MVSGNVLNGSLKTHFEHHVIVYYYDNNSVIDNKIHMFAIGVD
jgi:hypothetical protein